MASPRHLASTGERSAIGQWFESVAGLVATCPSRVATAANRIIYYDQTKISRFTRHFNAAAEHQRMPSNIEKIVACKHVYSMAPDQAEKSTDAQNQAMLESMQKLFAVCKLNRIGVAVHMPEPGVIEIELVPQERPRPAFKIKPPKIRFEH